MAPRGLSAEDKRIKLLEIFHESRDFYQLKELEKLGPKLKGIVSQSVKEVLQSLVDDGLVQGEKIGSSNFFWSFPSQKGAVIQGCLKAAMETQKNAQQQLQDLRTILTAENSARKFSDVRTESLKHFGSLKQQFVTLESELSAYGDSDPAKIEETKRAVFLAKEATLRWTDNYSVLLGYFTRQTGVDPTEVRKFLEIEEGYEDIQS